MLELGPPCPAARPGSWLTGQTWTSWCSPSATKMNHPDLRANNIEIHATGHMSLLINGDVVHGISTGWRIWTPTAAC